MTTTIEEKHPKETVAIITCLGWLEIKISEKKNVKK